VLHPYRALSQNAKNRPLFLSRPLDAHLHTFAQGKPQQSVRKRQGFLSQRWYYGYTGGRDA
jgi:hypothetical protein